MTQSVRTRKEVAALIREQFARRDDMCDQDDHTPRDMRPKGTSYSYGKQELRELLDFIYGGTPQEPDECIMPRYQF